MTDELAIDVRDLTKSFGKLLAVNHISLSVKRGEICGFLGPNGSGKTTFLRMLCGLLRPDAGRGKCLGYDVVSQAEILKREVGYMTQRFSFYEDLTIRENLEFVARVYSLKNIPQLVEDRIERLGLSDRQHQLAGQLSGGWKQRLALAACLLHDPKLLLLDEPTAGVDPKARREFWEEIHKLSNQGLTFLIATHYMDEAERCHSLAFIARGKLLATGSTEEVIRKSNLVTWSVSGLNLAELANRLRQVYAIKQTVPFGNTLHVSGNNREELQKAIAPFMTTQYSWREIAAGLEDVFIDLMAEER